MKEFTVGQMITYCERSGAVEYAIVVKVLPKHLIIRYCGKTRKVSKGQCL